MTDGDPEGAQEALEERTCTALGRCAVSFSGLLMAFEMGTLHFMGVAEDKRLLTQAALADRTAARLPLRSSLCCIWLWGDRLGERDNAILQALRTEIDAIVKTRNRLMRDAWLGGFPDDEGTPALVAGHRVRAHGKGAERELEEYAPERLDAFAQRVGQLSYMINSMVWNVGPTLSRNFDVVEKLVQRIPGRAEDAVLVGPR